jgi:hypothetical protein
VAIAPSATRGSGSDGGAANPNEVTTNVTKAREYGIPIIAERDFWLEVGVDEAALGKSRGRWAQPVRPGWASGRN